MADAPARFDLAFSVPCTHRLRFTRDVFGDDADVLSELLEPSGTQPARIQFWVDAHVAAAQPQLKSRIRRFVRANAGRVMMPGNIQIVPGGEAVKNDIHILERMLKVHSRRRPRPPQLRRGHRRRRGAGRGRLRGGDLAPRHPAGPAADDHARAGRLRRRRQEQRQPVRQEELVRHVRRAVGRGQRRGAAGDACRIATSSAGSPRR